MFIKFFLCIGILLSCTSSGSNTEDNENLFQKYSRRTTYAAAVVGAFYTAQQLVNDVMGTSEIPMDSPTRRALSYTQAVFASMLLDKTLEWAYAASRQVLERIAHSKFGNQKKYIKARNQRP